MLGPAKTKWTNATIARIITLHTCPARCGARRRGETAKLGSAPCLPSITSKLLSRHQPRVSPGQPGLTESNHQRKARSSHACANPTVKSLLRLSDNSHRLNADPDSHRHPRKMWWTRTTGHRRKSG